MSGTALRCVVPMNTWRRFVRFFEKGEERRVDAARRRATSKAIKILKRRRHRREQRALGYRGTMKKWWRRFYKALSIEASRTPPLVVQDEVISWSDASVDDIIADIQKLKVDTIKKLREETEA